MFHGEIAVRCQMIEVYVVIWDGNFTNHDALRCLHMVNLVLCFVILLDTNTLNTELGPALQQSFSANIVSDLCISAPVLFPALVYSYGGHTGPT